MKYYLKEEKKSIFYRERISLIQWVTFIVYVLVSVALILWHKQADTNKEEWLAKSIRQWLGFYTLFTQALFYVFHRQFRNINLFMVWVGAGVMHLWMSMVIQGDSQLLEAKLQYTIPALLLIQVLRLLSYQVIKDDFSIVSKFSTVDIDKGRKINFWDVLIF